MASRDAFPRFAFLHFGCHGTNARQARNPKEEIRDKTEDEHENTESCEGKDTHDG
jgi:hypothetical protein